LKTEHIILPRVIGWLAEGRLVWRDGRVFLDGRALDAPVVEDFDAAKEPSVAGRLGTEGPK